MEQMAQMDFQAQQALLVRKALPVQRVPKAQLV
jgi:hypothetical protein